MTAGPLKSSRRTPSATISCSSREQDLPGRARSRRAGARALRASSRHRRRRPDRVLGRPRPARRCACSMPTAATRRCQATASAAWAHGWRRDARAAVPGERPIDIETDAGVKRLELLGVEADAVHVPRRDGLPEQVDANDDRCRRRAGRGGHAAGRQPAVRGPRRSHGATGCTRSPRSWPSIPHFPDGTNVELATRRGAGPRPHPDLGTRGRPDRGVWHRRVRRGGGRDRRTAAPRSDVQVVSPGRRAARRVDGPGPLPHRMGRARRRSGLAGVVQSFRSSADPRRFQNDPEPTRRRRDQCRLRNCVGSEQRARPLLRRRVSACGRPCAVCGQAGSHPRPESAGEFALPAPSPLRSRRGTLRSSGSRALFAA